MKKYNPNQTPDPEKWNAIDESERIILIEQYHERKCISVPNKRLHTTIHTIVENQVAMGDEINVARTLDRLMSEGLDRHEAIHAIGCVLAEHLHDMLGEEASEVSQIQYFACLEKLTPEEWRRMYEQED